MIDTLCLFLFLPFTSLKLSFHVLRGYLLVSKRYPFFVCKMKWSVLE